MMKVTDLPSGQRLVWPLQIFTRSARANVESAFDLLETMARSRPAASEAPAVARNNEMTRALRKNTLAPVKKIPSVIFVEFGRGLNGQEGHVPLEQIGSCG